MNTHDTFTQFTYMSDTPYNYTDAYGSSNYNGNTSTSTGDAGSSAAGGSLANTGYDVFIPVILGALMIVGSGALFFKMKMHRGKKASSEQ